MQRSAMDLGVEFDVWHTRHDRPGARSAGSRFVSAAVAGARSGRRLACALAVGALIVAGTLVTGPAYAQSFPKDYSETVYKSAYARILTRNPKSAVEPLRILMSADPDLAHVQNLLAVALLALNPAEPEVAFEHAKRAVAIDPDVPQFVVVHVLTDVRKTKIGKDRVARLTRAAARELSEAAGKLSGMKGNAKRLGKLLKEIKETGADPDFPFEFKGMKNIFKRPNAVLTHPDKGSFTVAQRVLEQKIRSRRQKLDRDKDQANEEQRQAQARQREIEQQVAAAAERQRRVEKAKSRALEKVEKAAIEAAANAKRVAEIDRQRKLMAEAEERRLADERRLEQKRLAEERRIAEERRLAEEQRLAEQREATEAERQAELRRQAEELRLAEERRLAGERRLAEEKRRAEEEAGRKAEAAQIAEDRRKAIAAEDAERQAEEELALIAKAEEESRKEQEAIKLAQELAAQRVAETGRKAREAEKAANVPVEVLIQQIAEQEEMLQAQLKDEPPRIKVTSALEAFDLDEGSYQIAGLVGDMEAPPRTLTVNGERVPLFRLGADDEKIAEHNRKFRVEITPKKAGLQTIVFEVFDATGNSTKYEKAVKITVRNRPSIKGKNYALIIGNNDYKAFPKLKTAVKDATALAELLEERYAFEKENIALLTDATRRDIMSQLSRLRKTLGSDDRLMLYYAGHGQVDAATLEGFWQPVDAEPENDFTWISNADVRRYVNGMAAKHVLIIADSCFSGSLTRGAETQNEAVDKFFLNIDSFPSRKVISSGGDEPVADAGLGGHSIFSYYLLKALRNNDKPYITSSQLFSRLVKAVTNNSNQVPQFGTVAESVDQGSGDFTFIRGGPRG